MTNILNIYYEKDIFYYYDEFVDFININILKHLGVWALKVRPIKLICEYNKYYVDIGFVDNMTNIIYNKTIKLEPKKCLN